MDKSIGGLDQGYVPTYLVIYEIKEVLSGKLTSFGYVYENAEE
jgi:hypothetical protein